MMKRLAPGRVLMIALGLALLAPASSRAQIAFTDVTASVNLDIRNAYTSSSSHGLGILWVDVDQDRLPDLFLVNGFDQQLHLFRNKGDGKFAPRDDLLPALPNVEVSGAVFGDYDNDGDQDIYLHVSNEQFDLMGDNDDTGPPNILLQNQIVELGGPPPPETPLFVDVAAAAGVDNLVPAAMGTYTGYRSLTGGWLDYDLDGCLDLFVGSMDPSDGGSPANLNTLYHNRCDGTFEDVTTAAGLNHTGDTASLRPTLAFLGARLDADAWPDMYVVNVMYPTPTWVLDNLYLNDGDGTFTDVVTGAAGTMGNDTGGGMGVDIADIDFDGDWDIYLSDVHGPMNDEPPLRNVLYLGDGPAAWTDNVAPTHGVNAQFSWGVNFFDVDNDGDEDLFVAGREKKYLYENDGTGMFTDVSGTIGFPQAGDGRGSAVADYDRDGRLDLAFVTDSSATEPGVVVLYRNTTANANNYLLVDLVPVVSNGSAIHTLVKATTGAKTQMRQVKGGSSAHSQDMLTVHFGLGAAEAVDELHIEWPSGIVQTLTDVPANGIVEVVEEAALPVELAAFAAHVEDGRVLLSWRAAATAPTAFEVQQRRDGRFATVAEVPAEVGEAAYRHVVAAEAGPHAFRLRWRDDDGRLRHGPVVEAFVELAEAFALSPAYPNPFNPSTRFTVTVRERQPVLVEAYDLLGRRAAVLFDGVLEASTPHPVVFDAAGLASGLYVLRATGRSFSASRTVLLAR